MLKRLMTVGLLGGLCLNTTRAAEELEQNFVHPPDSARPWVYLFENNGNLTSNGITADLQAMARVGIGGVVYFEVDQLAPKGPVSHGRPGWHDLMKHLISESKRLGLQVNMNNGPGWCGSGGPWITPELSMQRVVWSETLVTGPKHFDAVLPQPKAERDFYRDIAVFAYPTPSDDFLIPNLRSKSDVEYHHQEIPLRTMYPVLNKDSVIAPERLVNLTAKLGPDGRLAWDVPEGKWTLLRLGHTTTGQMTSPATTSGLGLECDKLSKAAVEAQFNGMMAKVIADVGPLAGKDKTLVATHIDSWEVGSQNWTPKFREEFQRLRGYDPLPFLPVLTGRVVDTLEVSERFLWDVRQTVADLVNENYAGHLRELAKRKGLRLSIEAYGSSAPTENMTYAAQADEPMSEFWAWTAWGPYEAINPASDSWREMSSAAHVYGKPILGAESFTSIWTEKWLGHPANIKNLGDHAFCEGVNRFVFHRYAQQPWTHPDRAPGMSFGPWGLHYDRTQTWWEQSKAWHKYLSRCQYLLQQGLFVADLCLLTPERQTQNFAGGQVNSPLKPGEDRSGYNFDLCPAEAVITRMSVKDGRLVLPDGMSYRMLVLPKVQAMTPQLLRKIRDLVQAGATVLAMPPVKSPSLQDYPKCDAEVQALARELWGDGEAPAELTIRNVGKGRVIWGRELQKEPDPGYPTVGEVPGTNTPREIIDLQVASGVLAKQDVPPDFKAEPHLRYIHKQLGDTDLYFVANPKSSDVEALCTFRISGKQPELWRPDTGSMELAAAFEEKNGVTSLPLRFEPNGSVFVLFRKASKGRQPLAGGKNWPEFKTALEIAGPWEVRFDPKWGGPCGKGEGGNLKPEGVSIVFEKLVDWSKRPEDGIKYYSGTAAYRKVFDLEEEVKCQKLEVSREKTNKGSQTPEVSKKSTSETDLRPLASDLSPRVYLDLGKVAVMAEVKLNGKDLGILWKPPYRVEVTDVIKLGENKLEIRVVNLWINRMIGDEQLPEDSNRKKGQFCESILAEWPQWLNEGKPSPAGRFTFTSHRLWGKNDALVPSGLLGPVTLQTAAKIDIKP